MLTPSKSLAATLLLCLLAPAVACSRQSVTFASNPPVSNNSPQLPFNRTSEGAGISPTAHLISEQAPAGTSLVVRLQSPLSSADARPGDRFDAILDEPIAAQEHILAQRGAPLQGRVVAVEPARSGQNSGYLRLTLVTIVINGKSFALETSSMFAKGNSEREQLTERQSTVTANLVHTGTAQTSGPRKDVKFSTGRRLVFRLAQPLAVQN
jgi:hypothetical protein